MKPSKNSYPGPVALSHFGYFPSASDIEDKPTLQTEDVIFSHHLALPALRHRPYPTTPVPPTLWPFTGLRAI